MSEHVIATIPKNRREELRVSLGEYRGHQLVSLRVWFEAQDGTMRPGNSGVALKVEALPELVAAIIEAERVALATGLLGPVPAADSLAGMKPRGSA